jgi:hypothetical protein
MSSSSIFNGWISIDDNRFEVQLGKLSNFDEGKRQINFNFDLVDDECEWRDDFDDDDNDDIYQKETNK